MLVMYDVWIEADHHSNYGLSSAALHVHEGACAEQLLGVRTLSRGRWGRGKPGVRDEMAGPAELPSVYEAWKEMTNWPIPFEWRNHWK